MDLVVSGLTKKFEDKTVLDRLCVTFRENRITALLGGSGVGKTTLLRCIAGLSDYEGEILGAEEGVAYVFQEDRLIPHLTVYDNLLFTAEKNTKKEKIAEILRAVELTEEAARLPSTLSGGQRKRVSLARAFLSPKKVLLMDEPFGSLDAGLKKRLKKVFFDLNEKYPKTVVFVTHDIEEALAFSDDVFALGRGGIAFSAEILSAKETRDVADDRCNAIRRDLLSVLS